MFCLGREGGQGLFLFDIPIFLVRIGTFSACFWQVQIKAARDNILLKESYLPLFLKKVFNIFLIEVQLKKKLRLFA